MKLFEIDPDEKTVSLNKPWIMLIPEFAVLFKRDKGSEGDYRGDLKLRTRKELTFIYFYVDFSSPIRDWEPTKKYQEALYYANLKEDSIDTKVKAAIDKYMELMMNASRSLRTLKALYKGMDAMDDYFEAIDFKVKDKLGKLLNDPSAFVTNAGKLNKMYDEVRNFEKRVEQDLAEDTGIRGTATLGDNENKRREVVSEQDIIDGSAHVKGSILSGGSFNSMLKEIQTIAKTERKATLDSVQPDSVHSMFPDEEDEVE